MAAVEARGVSPKTWNDTLKLLRATFKHLHPHLNDGCNPIHGLVMKATETVNREPFTVEELKAILDACADDDFIRPLIITGMCTTMRRGDCCLLKWVDVDTVPAELGHRLRRNFSTCRHLPERQPEQPERTADLRGLEPRRLLAGPARRGIRLHGRRDPGDVASDHGTHRHRRSGQRNIPDRIRDLEHHRRRLEAPRRVVVVGDSDRGRRFGEVGLPRGQSHCPAGQRKSGRSQRHPQRYRARQRIAGGAGREGADQRFGLTGTARRPAVVSKFIDRHSLRGANKTNAPTIEFVERREHSHRGQSRDRMSLMCRLDAGKNPPSKAANYSSRKTTALLHHYSDDKESYEPTG
jgi:integrase